MGLVDFCHTNIFLVLYSWIDLLWYFVFLIAFKLFGIEEPRIGIQVIECLYKLYDYRDRPCHTIPYHTEYKTIPYHVIPYDTKPYKNIAYDKTTKLTIPTILYQTRPYDTWYHTCEHTRPYHTIPGRIAEDYRDTLGSGPIWWWSSLAATNFYTHPKLNQNLQIPSIKLPQKKKQI